MSSESSTSTTDSTTLTRKSQPSDLIAAGCDVVTVQRALGHASATFTLNTDSLLWPTAEDRTRSAAADLMRQCGLGADSSYSTTR
jgi:hypothetical protein